MRSKRGWIVTVQPLARRGRTVSGEVGHLTFTRTEAREWARYLRQLPDRVALRARPIYVKQENPHA